MLNASPQVGKGAGPYPVPNSLVATKQAMIPQSMESLDTTISILQQKVEMLRDKLHFVMSPSYPVPSGEKPFPDQPPTSGLVDQLTGFANRVRAVNELIDDINNRTQL